MMRVWVVAPGITTRVAQLQPWRYLAELIDGLAAAGYDIRIVARNIDDTRGKRRKTMTSVVGNQAVDRLPRDERPDAVVWHVGTTSALRRFRPPRGIPLVAIFTSPLYGWRDLVRVASDIVRSPRTYATLAVGALIPDRLLVKFLLSNFETTIVLSSSTRDALLRAGASDDRIALIPPGSDSDLRRRRPPRKPGGPHFVYAGNARGIRGPDILIRAFALITDRFPDARLTLLCRREDDSLRRSEAALRRLIRRLDLDDRIQFVGGTLSRSDFLDRIEAATAVVLPFRLVPSEAPMVVLEAQALGILVIASDLPPIRALANDDTLLVPVGDTRALARTLTSAAQMQSPDSRIRQQAHYGWPHAVSAAQEAIEAAVVAWASKQEKRRS